MRVGIVDFLNSRPLAWGFLRRGMVGGIPESWEASYHPPSRVADLLRAGEIDVGLVPSVEAARIPGLRVVPGTCVGATREVRSVLLVLRRPIGEVRRLALDCNSRTSIDLVQVLLRDLWGAAPETVVRPPSAEGVEDGFDGALLIGDPALSVDRGRFEIVDLAAAWRRLTGRPFVFAVWAAREEIDPGALRTPFRASLDAGFGDLETIVAEASEELALLPSVVRSYLTENLRFELGRDEIAGLREFYRRCALHSLIGEDPSERLLDGLAEDVAEAGEVA